VSILFVAGVHGVGKSSCCRHVAERTGFQLLTASTLIKAERELAIAKHSKAVLDPAGNQELLIRGIRNAMKSCHERMILDGHFTLLKADGKIMAIEIEVFVQLELERIVVFRDDPAAICNRLHERDGQDSSISTVSVHQDAEIEQGRVVASNLGIPIFILNAFDEDGLARAIGLPGVVP